MEAYGAVDELNSIIGLAHSKVGDEGVRNALERVQRELFELGAELANPQAALSEKDQRIAQAMVTEMEETIDSFQAQLPALKAFILPGGSTAGALLHLARVVARRAERRVVTLSKFEAVSPQVLVYLNRLSDLLFVLARAVNKKGNAPETEWHGRRQTER